MSKSWKKLKKNWVLVRDETETNPPRTGASFEGGWGPSPPKENEKRMKKKRKKNKKKKRKKKEGNYEYRQITTYKVLFSPIFQQSSGIEKYKNFLDPRNSWNDAPDREIGKVGLKTVSRPRRRDRDYNPGLPKRKNFQKNNLLQHGIQWERNSNNITTKFSPKEVILNIYYK